MLTEIDLGRENMQIDDSGELFFSEDEAFRGIEDMNLPSEYHSQNNTHPYLFKTPMTSELQLEYDIPTVTTDDGVETVDDDDQQLGLPCPLESSIPTEISDDSYLFKTPMTSKRQLEYAIPTVTTDDGVETVDDDDQQLCLPCPLESSIPTEISDDGVNAQEDGDLTVNNIQTNQTFQGK